MGQMRVHSRVCPCPYLLGWLIAFKRCFAFFRVITLSGKTLQYQAPLVNAKAR